MKITAIVAATAAAWAVAGAASADVWADLRREGCWTRTYDAAHLRANPRQVTTMFGVQFSPTLTGAPAGRRTSIFLFQTRGSNDVYGGQAYCTRAGAGVTCSGEGDAGNYRIDPRPGGGLRVTVTDRLSAEGANGFSPELGGRDDRVFDLGRSPAAACNIEGEAE